MVTIVFSFYSHTLFNPVLA